MILDRRCRPWMSAVLIQGPDPGTSRHKIKNPQVSLEVFGGGAGNRTPVREGSPQPSFTCVVVISLTTEFADSAATYLSLNLNQAIESTLA